MPKEGVMIKLKKGLELLDKRCKIKGGKRCLRDFCV